ncbi:Death-associated protein 1 [Camelus dromedarius]|uniref:Death-associated protein 1 n=1 Tax=Camelus dromedarius TaxID=9838 RepID=A0A5N4EBZ6_CAMDR|nr:Death-associated protein 1 [Camelus dromedarius]
MLTRTPSSRGISLLYKRCPPKPTVFISGVIARGDKDFPPAAAQVAHQKPHASMDKHSSPRTQHIQQPRK